MINEKEIIIEAQKGDLNSFEVLVKLYEKKVLGIAYSFINNEDDAKDIYQEVFLRVFRGLKTFQFKSEFSTWIHRITINYCLSRKNSQKSKKFVSIHDEVGFSDDDDEKYTLESTIQSEERTDDQILKKEFYRELHSAMNDLSEKQRFIFILKYMEGLKLREIAEILKLNEGSVKRYLFIATKKLKSKLEFLR